MKKATKPASEDTGFDVPPMPAAVRSILYAPASRRPDPDLDTPPDPASLPPLQNPSSLTEAFALVRRLQNEVDAAPETTRAEQKIRWNLEQRLEAAKALFRDLQNPVYNSETGMHPATLPPSPADVEATRRLISSRIR
jgi:hypothetical protein